MTDAEGIRFLQWCLPRLGLRWPGFRRVRRHVYKRIDRRLRDLGLPGVGAYRAHLEACPGEWVVLDALCWMPISRFCRDRGVFDYMARDVLPRLAMLAVARGQECLRCWSVGCASGEEPYTLAILWKLGGEARFPGLRFEIVATDIDPGAIERARRAHYSAGSLRDLSTDALSAAFVEDGAGYQLRDEFVTPVRFFVQDVRFAAPEAPFQLVLCRNVVFTYFDDQLQRRVLRTVRDRIPPGGALVIGATESLPEGEVGFESWSSKLRVFRRSEPG